MEGFIIGVGFIGGGVILKYFVGVLGIVIVVSFWVIGVVGGVVGYGLYDIVVIFSVVIYVMFCWMVLLKEVVCIDDEGLFVGV